MRISPTLFGILVLVIFLGTILGFQAAGVWSVSGKTKDGQAVQPSAEDVETIKGWMTLDQISTAYNVPLAELLAQFSLPADTPASTAIKDLESDTFSAEELRTWLQERMQNTSPEVEETPQFQATPTPVSIAVEALPTPLPVVDITPTPLPTDHTAPENKITGKTTFQDLLDWGLSVEAIQAIIGGELPVASMLIKDYVTQQGMEFAPIKTALQAEVDALK